MSFRKLLLKYFGKKLGWDDNGLENKNKEQVVK